MSTGIFQSEQLIFKKEEMLPKAFFTGNMKDLEIRTNDHIARPRNSFIIYRSEKYTELKSNNLIIDGKMISKIIAKMWNEESPEIKNIYALKAQEEKQIHGIKYPDYKYALDVS